jgi:hypothetical protein
MGTETRDVTGEEERAVRRLIAEIDSLDAWRDRAGKRILVLFFCTFAAALCLLFWAVAHSGNVARPPGPHVPGVMHSELAVGR